MTDRPTPIPLSNVVQLRAPTRATRAAAPSRRIAEAITRGDLVAAATLIADARTKADLTLREDIALASDLLPLLASRDVPLRDARRAAAALGWLDASGDLPAGAAFDRLRDRLAAERWFDDILAASARRHPFDARAAAARRLLGHRPALFRRLVRPHAALRTLVSELAPFREWLEPRLDPDALDEARRLLSSS